MEEIKVNLTITLKGSVLLSKEECLKTTLKEIIKKNKKTGKSYKKLIEVQVEDFDKMDKHTICLTDENGKNEEYYNYYTRKCKPAYQTININKEAYSYMISSECPEWSNNKTWSHLNKIQRLEEHLKRIAEGLNGSIVSYKVLDD